MDERTKQLAEEAGICPSIQNIEVWIAQGYELELFADLVRRDEREACAKLCDELVIDYVGRSDLTAQQCAAAIRARSKHD